MVKWAQAHTHLATLVVLVLLALFFYLNVVFAMLPLIILACGLAAGTLYFAVYFMIKDI